MSEYSTLIARWLFGGVCVHKKQLCYSYKATVWGGELEGELEQTCRVHCVELQTESSLGRIFS